ncbi:hypothetical protein ORI20_13735 [Mycobacterium sp. CVI_P3]|uniref:Uncharacterized protein n=1 Tax=Mycobacterium pinniadriaticum TaxID=2994102 RepID=A0ABT3SF67_9MYCO|nr:hypothetical protein [Mycobacterium pinniadriaticum]MCX2931340.1 hypothetical protein [Mycobacterium pinniadriaticum]MCX2937764.1 hypothetical protein [Mycobacterium pinniadriaticum]
MSYTADQVDQIEACLERGGHFWTTDAPIGGNNHCTRCPMVGALITAGPHDFEGPRPTGRPEPVEGSEWEYRPSTSDGARCRVRYHDGQWWAAGLYGPLDWQADSRIPEWPGTFTPAGGMVTWNCPVHRPVGNDEPMNAETQCYCPPIPLARGCSRPIPGSQTDLLAKLNEVYKTPYPKEFTLPPKFVDLMTHASDQSTGSIRGVVERAVEYDRLFPPGMIEKLDHAELNVLQDLVGRLLEHEQRGSAVGPTPPAPGLNGRWVLLGEVGVDSASIAIHDHQPDNPFATAPKVAPPDSQYAVPGSEWAWDAGQGIRFWAGFGDGSYKVWAWVADYRDDGAPDPDERIAQIVVTMIDEADLAEWRA